MIYCNAERDLVDSSCELRYFLKLFLLVACSLHFSSEIDCKLSSGRFFEVKDIFLTVKMMNFKVWRVKNCSQCFNFVLT